MSEIKQPLPFLSLSALLNLQSELLLSAAGEGWFLGNRLPDNTDQGIHCSLFLQNSMAAFQFDCIGKKVGELSENIRSFAAGDFEAALQRHNRDSAEDDPEFDPYEELEFLLTTDGIYDLPDSIERFHQLLEFAKTAGIRRKAMDQAFSKFFGGLSMYRMGVDESGNKVMINMKDLPQDVAEDLNLKSEVKREREAIEIEYCLSGYNEWLKMLTSMVNDRRPFSEMLPLFRD